ncbi:hypothetical protein M569_01684, partial [Genlisea aurea]
VGKKERKKKMGETRHQHNHNRPHPPPSMVVPPPMVARPMGAPMGPIYPPAEQLLQLKYCIQSNPSWVQIFLLGFQHYVVMLGTTVMIATLLVPQMGGGPGDKARVIQTILFMSGFNTLFQTWIGTRLPTVIGPSFAYAIPVLGIINGLSDSSFTDGHERFLHTMRTIQGSLIISSLINIGYGYSCAWGRLTRLFSPVVLVPLVSVAGLGLFPRSFPQLANCVEIGLPMLLLLVLTQQ